jgi:hypothetical protein
MEHRAWGQGRADKGNAERSSPTLRIPRPALGFHRRGIIGQSSIRSILAVQMERPSTGLDVACGQPPLTKQKRRPSVSPASLLEGYDSLSISGACVCYARAVGGVGDPTKRVRVEGRSFLQPAETDRSYPHSTRVSPERWPPDATGGSPARSFRDDLSIPGEPCRRKDHQEYVDLRTGSDARRCGRSARPSASRRGSARLVAFRPAEEPPSAHAGFGA